MKKFEYLRVYNSPFKPPKIKLYYGKVAIGTPYFLPRKWVKNGKGYLKAIPRIIGFDFVSLGWKTKYDSFRFEWNPLISFVFFKWQVALIFIPEHPYQFWESWLYYTKETKGTTEERIVQCRKEAEQTWRSIGSNETEIITDYYNLILKDKWLK
mgnify:CR=1 FL=1